MSYAPDTLEPADTWRTAAACTRPNNDPDWWFADLPADRGFAIAICHDCPVLAQCRTAVEREESGTGKESRYGIRAGMTPAERWEADKTTRTRTMPSGGGRPLAPCGTRGAYDRHLRLGEPVDDACRRANNAKRNQRPRDRSPIVCGTQRGYRKHHRLGEPACDACRRANADADRRLRNTGTTKVPAA